VALEEYLAGAQAIENLTRFRGVNGNNRVLRAHIAADNGDDNGDSYRKSSSHALPPRYMWGSLALYSGRNGSTIGHATGKSAARGSCAVRLVMGRVDAAHTASTDALKGKQ